MHQIIHIHADAPLKPDQGGACNGCGVCCLVAPCPVGMLISRKRTGACHALEWSDELRRYRCGLMVDAAQYIAPALLARAIAPLAARFIAAGEGCDCDVTVDTAANRRLSS